MHLLGYVHLIVQLNFNKQKYNTRTMQNSNNTTDSFVVKAYQTRVYLLQVCIFATGLQTSKVSVLQNEHLDVIAKVLPLTRTYRSSSQLHLQILRAQSTEIIICGSLCRFRLIARSASSTCILPADRPAAVLSNSIFGPLPTIPNVSKHCAFNARFLYRVAQK